MPKKQKIRKMYVYTYLILQFIMTNVLFQTVQVKYIYLIHKKILYSLTVISPFCVHEMDREKDRLLVAAKRRRRGGDRGGAGAGGACQLMPAPGSFQS